MNSKLCYLYSWQDIMREVQMALAKCGGHQNDMHRRSAECNVFVCANVHVHFSGGFYYILSGDGWMPPTPPPSFFFCCNSAALPFTSHHKTRYLPLSSPRRGIDYLLRISKHENAPSTTVISQMLSGTPIFRRGLNKMHA